MVRPDSLYLPTTHNSIPIIDVSSYSPFPTFPGSNHARDPYGLNAYLLHPADSMWSYVDPAPASSEDSPKARPSSTDSELARPLSRQKSITKYRSLSMLRRPSPLGSQPPVSSEEEDEHRPAVLRRRSSSLGSGTRQSTEQQLADIMAELGRDKRPKTPSSMGKKSFRRALQFSRKNLFGQPSETEPLPPVPAVPDFTISAPRFEDLDPTTPMSSRCDSNYSTTSSASSATSSEGVQTPNETLMLDVGVAGGKLADALAQAGEKKGKSKTWRGWLGGKRGNKAAQQVDSQSASPHSDAKETDERSPHMFTPPTLTLTPSPSIDSPVTIASSLVFPSAEQRRHTQATEQLRRLSSRKMNQLHQPSPHPLAMALRRQHCNLPDEVAFSIPSGQKVFPLSVNPSHPPGSGLNPAQGGLWLSIAIRAVMLKLDEGHQPPTDIMTRKDPAPVISRRPRGLADFVERPRFEERTMVFYADGVFSPVSMARPAYGVWDLDFSDYIETLAEVDELHPWPSMPKASVAEDINDLVVFTSTTDQVGDVEDSPMEATRSEELHSPGFWSKPQVLVTPADGSRSTPPLSSFRNVRKGSHTWDSSSDEESEEESDEEPFAQSIKKSSTGPHQTQTGIALPTQATSSHARMQSQPTELRASRHHTQEAEDRWKETQQKRAMKEVAKARERREATMSGETERRAEIEQRRIKAAPQAPPNNPKRFSSVDPTRVSPRHQRIPSGHTSHRTFPSKSSVSRPASMPLAPASPRRRVQSQYDIPSISQARSRPSVDSASRRYHSFYEAPAALPNVATFAPPVGMMYTHPSVNAFHQPIMMPQFPPMGLYHHPSRSSLVIPSQLIGTSHRHRMA